MKTGSETHELLLSDTSVPDLFIVQYMQDLSKDAIALYLWLLMNGKKTFNEKDAKSFGLIPESDIGKALSELVSASVIIRKEDGAFLFEDLKKREVDSYIKSAKEGELADTALSADEKARNVLAGSINKTFYQGNMPYLFYRLVDKCLYEYKFDSPVVYSLFEEGRDKRIHLSVAKMYALAQDWSDKGYNDPQRLSTYLSRRNDVEDMISLMGKLMRRRMNDLDIQRIEHWVNDYGSTKDLVEYAFKVNEFRGNITTKHVDDKLKEWYAADISGLDKAMVYENERKNENQKKSRGKRAKDNSWKTGSEAGIVVPGKKEDIKTPEKEDPADHDEILDMFGNSDEDD